MSRMGTAVDAPKACCAQALHCAGEAAKRLRRPGRLQTDHAKRAMGFGRIVAQGLGYVRLMGPITRCSGSPKPMALLASSI